MPEIRTLASILIGLAPLALFVLLISHKLRRRRRYHVGTAPSLGKQLSVGLLLALAMAGGAIGGLKVGFLFVMALVDPAERITDHPIALILFFASVLGGFLAPAAWYWWVSRKFARPANGSIDNNDWLNVKGPT